MPIASPLCSFLTAEYILGDQKPTASKYRNVFYHSFGERDGVKAFLTNIFMQLDEGKFFTLIDSILDDSKLTDDQIYEQLITNISKTRRDIFFPFSSIHALEHLKQDLASFVFQLLEDKKNIHGYVEIGYNGRLVRSLKKKLSLSKPIFVVNDRESFRDYLERGARPYDAFVPLNNYEPIPEHCIPTASVDLVACYIGLHHIPQDKLGPFLASIQRILKPGGSFILMEHDACTKKLQELVHVVHSIFNAATGVAPEENKREIRDFHALKYWIDKIEAHNLKHNVEEGSYIRKGDSTLNTLLRFDKPLQDTLADFPGGFPGGLRPQLGTYLTAPEWHNVRSAQEYARFVENKPFYQYPYFADIGGYWKTFGNSWKATSGSQAFSQVATSDYTLMNLFIGTTMTIEYGVKGILSTPFSLIMPKDDAKQPSENVTEAKKERLRSRRAYGDFINHTPFYQYPYFQDIKAYWTSYRSDITTGGVFSKDSAKNLLVGGGVSLEYAIKGMVSWPIRSLFTSQTFKEAETIHLLIQDAKDRVEALDPRVRVVNTYSDSIKHIEIPRYMVFNELIKKMATETDIRCLNIAGNQKIQVDVKSASSSSLNKAPPSGCRNLYLFSVPTDPAHEYTAYEVDVSMLSDAIRTFKNNGEEIIYIHDF
jgi:SAM-dependent methyltransferase